MTIQKNILDSADVSAITQLIVRERTSRDIGDWDTMRDCFHPDSIVHISWFNGNGNEFVTASIDMAKRNVRAKHRLSPILVELKGDRALGTLMGIIDIPMNVDGVDLILSAHGRFIYRVERRNNIWKIFGFECIYIRDELVPAVLGQSIHIDPKEIAPLRASYRNLAWCLMKSNYDVDPNLPGEDQPETANALMLKVRDWLAAKI